MIKLYWIHEHNLNHCQDECDAELKYREEQRHRTVELWNKSLARVNVNHDSKCGEREERGKERPYSESTWLQHLAGILNYRL